MKINFKKMNYKIQIKVKLMQIILKKVFKNESQLFKCNLSQ